MSDSLQALAVDPIPRTIQQIVRQGVSLCDDWQDLVKYLSFYFKNKRNAGDKNKKGRMLTERGIMSTFCRRCNNLHETKEDSCSVAEPEPYLLGTVTFCLSGGTLINGINR